MFLEKDGEKNMSGKKIRFIPERCIQCHGCEVACKTWRNVELGIRWRWVDTDWVGEYPDVTSYPVAFSCRQCDDPPCIRVCKEAAIFIDASGDVLVDESKCSGCKQCLKACPESIPQFGMDGKMQKCDLCRQLTDNQTDPPCIQTCPTQALQLD